MELHISQEAYEKVMFWVKKAKFEVSGFGKVVYDPDEDVMTVTDAYLLKQEGSAAETEIDDVALGKLLYETRNVEGDLRWWWHSHVQMSCTWSSTDRDTINKLGSNGWIAATVFNQREELRTAIAYKTETPFKDGDTVMKDDIKTFILTPHGPRHDEWEKEFKDKVTEKLPTWNGDDRKRMDIVGHLNGGPLYVSEGSLIQPSMVTPNEWDNDRGLIGYGVEWESAALGMTPESYWKVICGNDIKRIEHLEEKLNRLDTAGKFKGAEAWRHT